MRHIRPVSDEISINWRLTNFCNYACSYCPDVLHDKSDKIYDLFYYKNQIDKLINQLPSSIPIKLLAVIVPIVDKPLISLFPIASIPFLNWATAPDCIKVSLENLYVPWDNDITYIFLIIALIV